MRMTRLASVERRGAECIVSSPGFWKMNGHFARVLTDADVEDLGRALLDALGASNRITLREVDGSDDSFAPVLAALGLKTYAQYMRAATSVSVDIGDDGILRITPMRNGGVREGFVEMTAEVRVLVEPSAESLGSAVERAMDLASRQ